MPAIIFDLDGTLLDVRRGFYWQFQELTRFYDGAPVSREAINAAAHGTTEQIVRTLVNNTEVPLEDILFAHRKLRLQAYDQFLKLYVGVQDLLEYLVNNNFQVGALTSGNDLTVGCLSRTQIRHYFDSIISAEHVSRPKPHPEGLVLLISRLGVKPSDTIMVGDTTVDILVGKSMGVSKTIGVLHGFGKAVDLEKAGADHLARDIASIMEVIKNSVHTMGDNQALPLAQ